MSFASAQMSHGPHARPGGGPTAVTQKVLLPEPTLRELVCGRGWFRRLKEAVKVKADLNPTLNKGLAPGSELLGIAIVYPAPETNSDS